MSEQSPPPAPTHRFTTCAACTNEVRVDFYHEGPAQCEFCSGEMKGYHQILREQKKAAEEVRIRSGDQSFMERVDAVVRRTVPNRHEPGALGRCPKCRKPYVMSGNRVVHPSTPCYPVKS